MQNVFIRTGHGYEESDRGRCDAFDGFEIIAAPLGEFDNEARESRVYRRASGNGTDYGSHAIKLARMSGTSSGLYILMHHGGGREVWRIPDFYDGGDLAAHIVAMPERLQYALLYSLYKMGNEARYQAQSETRAEWATAIAEKRIRRKRGRVEIVPQWEIDLKAKASAAA